MAEKEVARQKYLQQQQERWEREHEALEVKRKQEEEERAKLMEEEAKRQKKREEAAEKRRKRKEAQEEQARKEAEAAAERARREAEVAAEKKKKRAEATARRKAREAAEAAASAASVTAASSQSPSEFPGISPVAWGSYDAAAAAAKAKALISEARSGAFPTVGDHSPVSSQHPLDGTANRFVVTAPTTTSPDSESRVAFRKRKSPPPSPKAASTATEEGGGARVSEEQLASMQGLTRSRRRASVRFSAIMDSMRGRPGGASATAKTSSEQQQKQTGNESDLPPSRRPIKKLKQEEKEERKQEKEGLANLRDDSSISIRSDKIAPSPSADVAAAAAPKTISSSQQPSLPHVSADGPQQEEEWEGSEWMTLDDSGNAPAGQSGFPSEPYHLAPSLPLPSGHSNVATAAAAGTNLSRAVPFSSSLYAAHPHPLSGGNPSHQIQRFPNSFAQQSTLQFGRPSGLVGAPVASAQVHGGAFAASPGGYAHAHARGGVDSPAAQREPTRSPQLSHGPAAVPFAATESRGAVGGFPRGSTCAARVPIAPRPEGSPGRQMLSHADPTDISYTAVPPVQAPLPPALTVFPSVQQTTGAAAEWPQQQMR
uniref:Uncharacterized protein n=1 Tax=Chromera velia CCMP2878 TaxID=1169474 RepID=A0A0G4ID23_9ALVE|eukprot:Cvel_13199.t1-p1 / transcript=Cvel_13199.t1 / gene=Cvel_13199 / organism=Chromera_velia_CCMP2878 / gene_product=hypothetical protein / transcript_product=hypothetical protein / location=Cvel_scaffold893:10759-12552(-) / protein_length=598 / sequence_SO=supercontig / SO=protein_coding / is_pseudo=false